MSHNQTVAGLPHAPNRFLDDPGLRRLLSQHLDEKAQAWSRPLLTTMGDASATFLDEWAGQADRNPPRLVARDRFGNRVDTLDFHPAYRELQNFAYGQGLVGGYYQAHNRKILRHRGEAVKFAHGYLFSQAEQGLYCPVCMTDGTAYLVEKYGSSRQKQDFLPHLTATNLDQLWEGAMFLTEKAGGSDVGATETTARPLGDNLYALSGEKWFCSNAGAELVMVLARPQGAPSGTQGLSLFAMRRHGPDGRLNNLHLERLKDKLGTRSMPTGEVILNGSVAELVGDPGRGFSQMADMLNLSRLYNATAAVAIMRRCVVESVRYANNRKTFGHSLQDYPLVRSLLVEMAVEQEAALHLMFGLYEWRGKSLLEQACPAELQLLRLFTPLAKLTTGRTAVWSASEAVEMHGGCGYIEDWPLARLLRDAQVLPIWEGTTNILALDCLRSIQKEGCHESFFDFVAKYNGDSEVSQATSELRFALEGLLKNPGEAATLPWCWQATRVMQATLLQRSANDERGRQVCEYYLRRHFAANRHSLSPDYLHYACSNHASIMACDAKGTSC